MSLPAIDMTAKRINDLHNKIDKYKKTTLEEMVECGRLLTIERNNRLGYFLQWLKTNIHFSERTAHKDMRVYKLKKTGWWHPEETVAENLRKMATKTPIQEVSEEIKVKKIRDIAPKLSYNEAQKITESFKTPPTPIVSINYLDDLDKKKIRIKLFKYFEECHELGRKDKILPMDKKREFANKIIRMIEKPK